MVICRYFLQGACRLGSNCKFDHIVNPGGHGHGQQNEGTSIMRQRNPSSAPAGAGPGAPVDVGTLIRSVQTDMLNCERGGQWLLSSYAPFREKATFPGFEDKSFEEVRLGFYEANAAGPGNVEEFNRQLQAAQQDMVMKIRVLQNPSEEVVKTLQTIYNTPINHGTPTQASPFGGTSGNSPLAVPLAQANTSIFAQNQGSAAQATGSIFGGQIQPTQSTPQSTFVGGSIFGGTVPPSQGIFAQAAQKSQSIFAQPQASIFAQAAHNAGSIFGGGTGPGPGATTNTASIFQSGNIFHQQPPPQQQQQVGAFPFVGQTLNNSIFNNQGKAAPQTEANMFQQQQQQQSRGNNPKFYSNTENLSEQELECFKADVFQIGMIPVKPPPIDLCF